MDNRHRKLLNEYKYKIVKKLNKKTSEKTDNDKKTEELDNKLR